MNFFEDQRRAKAQTNKLVLLYSLTVLGTALSTVVFVIVLFNSDFIKHGQWHMIRLDSPYIYYTFGVVSLLILSSSLIKIFLLGKGGKYVAKLAGATEVDLDTKDPELRKYINVVEEMSIASGTPMPAVYIMDDEDAINAFAAGYEINDAVIAVTRGSLRKLNRDELQGVIAHEFSHIFNGDMKLNIKLIGYLFGLSMIGEAGRMLMRSTSKSRRRFSSTSRDSNGQIAIIGLALMIIGYLGYFLASLLKAAISRQREFLADASSVQFTRNPEGIGGALKKIHVDSLGSEIMASRASEVSHMFFSDAINRFSSFFATHPPINERLKAIYPNFRMSHFEREEAQLLLDKLNANSTNTEVASRSPMPSDFVAGFTSAKVANLDIEKKSGQITQTNISYAKNLIESLPKSFLRNLNTAYGCKCLIYSMLVDENQTILNRQLEYLRSKEQPGTVQQIYELGEVHRRLNEIYRLPLIELAIPRLKKLSDEQIGVFLSLCKQLILADRKINIKEFFIYNFLKVNLMTKNKFITISLKKSVFFEEVKIILSFISYFSSGDDESKKQAFSDAIELIFGKSQKIISLKELSLNRVSQAIENLKSANIESKQLFLEACVSLVKHDGLVTVGEYEIVRLLAESIQVPLPPVVPSERAS